MSSKTAGIHRIVIVGAGYGGLVTLTHLQRRCRHEQNIELVLLNPYAYQESRTEMDIASDLGIPVSFCKIDISELIDTHHSRFIEGTMMAHDKKRHLIYYRPGAQNPYQDFPDSELKVLPYSQLILACGAAPFTPQVEGLAEHASVIWGLRELESFKCRVVRNIQKAAGIIREHRENGKACTDTVVQEVDELLTVSIIGAGATGVEIMMSLAHSAQEYACELGLNPALLNFQLFDGLDQPLAEFSPVIQAKASARLIGAGINLMLGSFVSKVDAHAISLHNGNSYTRGALAYAGGARAHARTAKWGLPQSVSGRIKVDSSMQVQAHSGIWALGDIASYEVVGGETPRELPMLAQHAMRQADIVVHNVYAYYKAQDAEQCITQEIAGFSQHNQRLRAAFKRYSCGEHGQFVSLGEDFALGWIGSRSFELSGKAALTCKRLSYMLYWITVGGMAFGRARAQKLRRIRLG